MDLSDYALGEVLYNGSSTRVCRAIHRPSGSRVVIKAPTASAPDARVMGQLVHEYEMLTKLAAVPGVSRARALVQEGGAAALVLEDPGFRSLDGVLDERGQLPVEAGLKLG